MQYFDTLPKIIYTKNGVSNIYTNLMARASLIPEFLKNPALYYKYSIQDSDTPEIIAYKYYGDSYRYWILLFTNELLDAQWDWPLTGAEFEKYIEKKYSDVNPHYVLHHYEKTITQYNQLYLTTTENTIVIDDKDYEMVDEQYYIKYVGDEVIEFTIKKTPVSLYDHEYRLNEAKRQINLLNSSYVDLMEKQLKSLMA
jgi:hypothetical protein